MKTTKEIIEEKKAIVAKMKTTKEIIDEKKAIVAKMKGISVEEYERINNEQVNLILNFLNNGK